MSLLDALLLDPPRLNTWIAFRTDGVKGTGTQTDPFDGSTLAKFDAVMSGLAENTCVHLGPGTFETAGYYEGISGSWQLKKGMECGDTSPLFLRVSECLLVCSFVKDWVGV